MRILLLSLIIFITNAASGQTDREYDLLIAKAGLLHLQKDHKNAIACYEKAFSIHVPVALEAYKAAGVYALDSNVFSAISYLNLALEKGWTEADWLINDPYFDYLRLAVPDHWGVTEKKAIEKEATYEKTLKLPALRKEINRMALIDQQLRYKRIQSKDKAETRVLNRQIRIADSSNLARAKEILKQYGWPKLSDIGADGQNNLWLIAQHADADVFFQQEALQAMEKLRATNEIRTDNYTFLYDRVQCNLNYRQLYGTQVNWTHNGQASGFRAIMNEDRVDQRRKELSLSTLDIYATSYGFSYKKKTRSEARKEYKKDMKKVRVQIDSARYYYKQKQYNKVYDLYNSASETASGMDYNANFEAAIFFSNIAAVTNDEKYRSIALDFLNLLFLRQQLTIRKLKAEPSFKLMYNEPRWIDMCKRLE